MHIIVENIIKVKAAPGCHVAQAIKETIATCILLQCEAELNMNDRILHLNQQSIEFIEEMLSQINLTSVFLESGVMNSIMEAIA